MRYPSYVMANTANMNTRTLSQVREKLGSSIDVDNEIDVVIEKLLEEKLTYTDKGYKDIRVDLSYDGGEFQNVYIYGYRPETASEFADRIKFLDERDAEQRETDLEQLEKLKKKLGV